MLSSCIKGLLAPLILISWILSFSSHAEGQQFIEAISQDLLLGESPFVQEINEIELGLIMDFPQELESARTSSLELELEYGFTERLTLAVELPFIELKDGTQDSTGLGDIELSILYGLIIEDDFILSAGIGTALLTGNQEKRLGENEVSWEPMISIGKIIGDTQLVFTAAIEISEEETEQNFTFGLAHQFDQIIMAIDFNAEISDDAERIAIAPSLLFDLQELGHFQIGIATGLDTDSPNWRMIAHWYIEFE